MWPNNITSKSVGEPNGPPDYQHLGFAGLEAVYSWLRVHWNKSQKQRNW